MPSSLPELEILIWGNSAAANNLNQKFGKSCLPTFYVQPQLLLCLRKKKNLVIYLAIIS